MKKIAMIPARYAATRFPFKLMQPLGNKTVIRQTYDNTVATGLFDDVIVVTDHAVIFDEIISNGGKAIMSIRTHESGSDRIAEAVEFMDADVVLNVQGDEPFVQKEPLRKLLEVFEGEEGKNVQVASLMKKFTDLSLVHDPNYVKVLVNKNNWSLLFSRSVIPYQRDMSIIPNYYEHIGVYAFRKEALLGFTKWQVSPLEAVEKLEQLRYLDNGIQLKMVETFEVTVKIDVPEDLEKAQRYWEEIN
jgi:3-deoxy-manno-octulosonate cytidylyltransferase (CMP-KDO synthetase)